jgi:hypothetical protein
MNQRPAGPKGLSARYTADIAIACPSGGSSSTKISTSAPLARSASTMCSGMMSNPNPGAQEVMLGREIAKTPYSRG